MSDSWAQEGRNHKAREIAKSEHYAEKGVSKPAKKARKRVVVEYRYTQEYYESRKKLGSWPSFFFRDNNAWSTYRKYETLQDAQKAVEQLNAKEANWREYRIKL